MTAPKNMPLPSFASPQRGQVMAALTAAGKPLTTAELALAAAVSLQTVRNIMGRMVRSNLIVNKGTQAQALWAPATPADQKPARSFTPSRVCNSRMPTMTARDLPSMGSNRPGANDHLQSPSRRPEGLVHHQPPLIIGSGISGGMR